MADNSSFDFDLDTFIRMNSHKVLSPTEYERLARVLMGRAGRPSYSQQTNNIAQRKVSRAIDRLTDMLPYQLAAKISSVQFGPDNSPHKQFEVVFNNGKVVVFDNIDTFPTEVDVARLCVEAP